MTGSVRIGQSRGTAIGYGVTWMAHWSLRLLAHEHDPRDRQQTRRRGPAPGLHVDGGSWSTAVLLYARHELTDSLQHRDQPPARAVARCK